MKDKKITDPLTRSEAKKAAFNAAYESALKTGKVDQKAVNTAYDKVVAAYTQQPKPAVSENAFRNAMSASTQHMQSPMAALNLQAHTAEKAYDDYVGSQEHKDVMAGIQKQSQNVPYVEKISGAPSLKRDPKEQELKAAADYHRQQVDAEKDRQLLQQRMAVINSWSQEDRDALEAYVREKDKDDDPFVNSNPFEFYKHNKRLAELHDPLAEKYGKEQLDMLEEAYGRYLHGEDAKNTVAETTEAVDNVPGAIGHNLLSVGANIAGSIYALTGRAGEMFTRTGQFRTLEEYNPGDLLNLYSDTVRGATAQNIAGEDGNIGRQALSVGYQGVMSFADTIARTMVGGKVGSLGLAAAGSFSRTMTEASKQGATPAQAAILAVGSAAIEAATEYIPLDEMLKAAKGGAKGGKAIIKEALKQAGIEATTEEIGLVGNLLYEAAVLREKSSYQQKIGELVANGASYAEAKKQADKDIWNEALNTAMVSGIAGGLSGGGSAYVGSMADKVIADTAAELAQKAPPSPEPAPMPEGLKNFDNAAAIANGMEPAVEFDATRQPQTVDASVVTEYNNITTENGGNTYGTGLQPNDRTGSFGNSDQRMAGVQQSDRNEAGRWGEHGGVAQHPGVLRVSDDLKTAREKRGIESYDLYDTSNSPQEYEQALIAGRNSDPVNGWCVTPKSAQELAEGNVRTIMNADKTVGIGVAADGDIVAVFKNKNGGPRRALDTAMPAAIEMGGDRLDCYGKGLVTVYEGYGFIPVARVEFNPEYANEGWTPDKGTPYIYVMMHNGDSAATVTEKMHSYKQSSKAELDALPTYGKEDYDAAMDYRNSLIASGKKTAPFANSTPTTDTQMGASNPSAEGEQGIKGTGAAEANFSGKPAYNATLSEDNFQADRRNDARQMELPRRDVNGGNISAVTGNVYGAGVTPDEFASLMEEPTARGDFSYVPISNNEATQQAMENITRYGWQDAYTQWSNDVHQGRAGAEMSARGALFLNHAAQAGDRRQWLNILSDFQRLGTNTAQGLQAFRILRNLAPSDRLYMMRRSVAQMVEDMHLNIPIEIDQQLADRYQNAETNEDADAILDEIIDDVAAQIPSTAADRWTALRYVNMLGNLRTQARNISGNIGAKVTYLAKDEIAAALETVAHAINPNFQRTKSAWVGNELKALGRADFDEVRDIILENGRFDDARRFDSTYFAREVNERRRIFRTEFMESYRRLTNWAMNNDYFGDAGFARSAYARSFGGYLKANGFTGSTLDGIDQDLLDNARLYAIQQAQESTFRDHNAVSDWVGRIGRRQDTPRVIRTLSEGVMPFRSTPANVLVRAEEFSPLGIINTAVTAARAANPNSEITGTDVVESMAKTLTGTGLFILGAYLGKMGILAGGPDPDDEQAEFDKMNGFQNYALQLPEGKNVTIDFLSPLAIPMFLGAETEKIISSGGYDLADFEKVFTSLADPLIQMSMLQGLNDTLDGIKYSENNLGQFFLNASMSYLTQGLTNTLMGQLERSTEKNRMTTYVDKDSWIPQWMQRQIGNMSQKIPGLDFQQMEYQNAWGETDQNEGFWQGTSGRLPYNMLSPGYISTERNDPVTTELNRLRDTTGSNVFPRPADKSISYTDTNGVLHKDYNLSAQEWENLQKVQGQAAKGMVETCINDPIYKAMTDDQKAKVIKYAYDYARETGRSQALPGYEISDGWIKDVRDGGTDVLIDKVITGAFTDAFGNFTDGSGEPAEELRQAYGLLSKMSTGEINQFAENAGGRVRYYIEAKRAGVKEEAFLDLYGKYRDIEAMDLSAGDKAAEWAHTLDQAQNAGQITQSGKNSMKENMSFGYYMPANTDKYDQLTEAGLDADTALDVTKLLDGITGTGSIDPKTEKPSVRNTDKYSAIAKSGYSDAEKDLIMKAYMPDSNTTELKYDTIRDLGYSPEEYADTYRVYSDNSKKADMIKGFKKLGYTDQEAQLLYKIYSGKYFK